MLKQFLNVIRYVLYAILAGCLVTLGVSCDSTGSRKVTLAEKVELLTEENAQLKEKIEQAESENEQLKQQLHTLSGVREEVKLDNVYNLVSIKITGYTNFYDKDKDGKKEKLIVYVQPIDEVGDVIKACGTMEVQLWDLNRENGQALLSQWQVNLEQLKRLWFASLITVNYRLVFDVTDIIDEFKDPLTVKVTFTDYLTGKVFKEQKIIKP